MKKGKYQTKGTGIRWPVIVLVLVVTVMGTTEEK